VRKEYLTKINNLPDHNWSGAPRGAGPPEARGRMQLHRLHWLKAGPDSAFIEKLQIQWPTRNESEK